MPEQFESSGGAEVQYFERGQRVAYGDRVGVVQSTFAGGLHYVFLDDEKRLITVPGDMLVPADDLESDISDSSDNPFAGVVPAAPVLPPNRAAPAV